MNNQEKQFANHLFEVFPGDGQINPKTITDDVFVFIQNNRELLDEYLTLIGADRRRQHTVNSNLAKRIKIQFGLSSTNTNRNNPQSVLIKSYTKLQ